MWWAGSSRLGIDYFLTTRLGKERVAQRGGAATNASRRGIGARLRAAVAAPPCPKGMNIISRRWNLRTKRRALSFWATPQGSNSTPSGLDCTLPWTFTVGFTYG